MACLFAKCGGYYVISKSILRDLKSYIDYICRVYVLIFIHVCVAVCTWLRHVGNLPQHRG